MYKCGDIIIIVLYNIIRFRYKTIKNKTNLKLYTWKKIKNLSVLKYYLSLILYCSRTYFNGINAFI